MSSKLRVPALLLAVPLTLLGAACTTTSGTSGTGATTATSTGAGTLAKVGNLEKTTLNVAVLANIDSAGFFVALHEGLFAQEGLRVNYTPAFSDAIIGGQAKGQYDIIGMNYVSYVQAQVSHRADLRIIAEGSQLEPGDQVIMTMPRSRIRSLQDLKGHVLGVNTTPNIGFLLVASMLAQDGIRMKTTPGYSADSVMLPTDPNFPFPASQPLTSGQVAAAIMSEPFATQLAQQAGTTIIADTDSGATSQFPILGYAVTKAWAKANPKTLKAFDTALEAGQEIADTNRAAVEAAFVSLKPGEGHVDQLTAALMALSNYPLGVDPVRLQRVADVMQEFGLLKHHFSIEQLLS
jgi:NitT/TauT family transport system substrate-binding protein